MLKPIALLCFLPLAFGQSWNQWGQNARHTGSVTVTGQRLEVALAAFEYDPLVPSLREDAGGDLLVHYMVPIVDGNDVYVMTRSGDWKSCSKFDPPCGTGLWNYMQRSITKLSWVNGQLTRKWSTPVHWWPVPDNGSTWEPVFHPALVGDYIFSPCSAGTLLKIDKQTGEAVERINPFGDRDANIFVTGPVTASPDGSLYYSAMKLNPGGPWSMDVDGAWMVRIGPDGKSNKVSFSQLLPNAPKSCLTSFTARDQLPWPPSSTAIPASAACGTQRPGLNAAVAVADDGTAYMVSRAHFNSSYSYLFAVNPDLSLQWAASLRDRLNDGCGVLLPQNGEPGGCRVGTTIGVDPRTNQKPAGQVSDQSTASPSVAPDGAILYGALTGYNHGRGHLMKFSAKGEYLAAFDFGWDNTPAIFAHDGTYSVLLKNNHYGLRSYCGVDTFCLRDEERYELVSLNANLKKEWGFLSTNTMACERQENGSVSCSTHPAGFEWCVNMVAVDREGVMYANSEDGNVYAIDRNGKQVGSLFLKVALGAAYTPLAIGPDGLIYTQNAGSLFVVGNRR